MNDTVPSGRELARLFHDDAVAPLLARAMPRLRYAAGRLGSGSDVLGLDDAMSRDHDWGCRLTLLVDGPDRDAVPQVRELLERELPESWKGWPVRFPVTWDTSLSHKVEVATVGDFAASRLGADPTAGLAVPDWLILTGQSVLEVIAGPVFTDQIRELAPARALLAWYPADVGRYVIACGWQKICQEMPMAGRIADRGDELGSRLLSARLADDMMWLAFALSRRWPPYPKWRGTVFRELPVAADLAGPLATAVTAPGWRERECGLASACEVLLSLQRARGLPGPTAAVTAFWDRPYRTVDEAVPRALLADISDPQVASLPPGIGSIEQWAGNVDLLAHPSRRRALRTTYHTWASPR
ncbi:MAG TPA: DUF4037 domain-containing protein [Streptosporangiaceae bacterium]|nr:DUF4037 domain-containing protein [Streptosporangiaceae bacterium]